MNGLNRKCVWLALDKPGGHMTLRDWLEYSLLAALFLALLA